MTQNLLRITKAKALKNFLVKVWLTDGTTRTLDIEKHLKGPVLQGIKANPKLFNQVKADYGTLTWPNGADLCPDVLLDNAIAHRVLARFKQAMPTICRFEGTTVYIPLNDHPPPHIHVHKGAEKALVAILTGKILEGTLSKPLHKTIRKWLKEKQLDVLRAYAEAQSGQIPTKVAPPTK